MSPGIAATITNVRESVLGLDVVAVLVFVVIGRRTHEEGLAAAGLARAAAPFIVALVVGWLATRAWSSPTRIRTGAGLAACTVGLGMVLRRWVVGDGTATSFVIVAAVFLAATLIGWRLVATRLVGSTSAA